MHLGPSRGKVGGKLPRAPQHLGASPVEYRKLEKHFQMYNQQQLTS